MDNPLQVLRFYRDLGEEFFHVVGDPVTELTFGGGYRVELWQVFHFDTRIKRFEIRASDFVNMDENTVTVGVYTISTHNTIKEFRAACRQYSNPPCPRSTIDS